MSLENELQRRREDCRRDVLAWLAIRSPNAFRLATIRARQNRDNGTDYSEAEIAAALAFRIGMNPPEIERVTDPAGADHNYRVTSAGQLHFERNEY
jgi:hypothetical protein